MFRLNSLELRKHPILGNIYFEFCSEELEFENDKLFSSIIIGPNGTGKSTVLKVIAEIFREISLYKADNNHTIKLAYNFRIKYSLHKDLFEIASRQLVEPCDSKIKYSGYSFFKNSPLKIEAHNIENKADSYFDYSIDILKLELPNIVLASSLMITDKFNAKSAGIYKYLGVRNENSPSSTGTRTYIRKTVDNIVEGFKRKNFANELEKLFNFLELDSNLILSYVPKYKWAFYKEDITNDTLFDLFENKWKESFSRRNTPLWGAKYFTTIKEDINKLDKIVAFLRKVHNTVFITGNKRSLDYDVINQDIELLNDYEMITELRHLDILSYPELSISKNNNSYSFITSSSGEAHMISEFIGILSQIQNNSVILIDEPEISLHPNWQIQYINHLKKIFHKYPSAHFIIATHSHFLLSNVTPKESSTIALEKDAANNIVCRAIDFSTLGWSPESILYNVFKVSTTRNYYFEYDVQKLLSLISSKSNNKTEMRRLIDKLMSYTLPNEDPLNAIINKAENYISNEI